MREKTIALVVDDDYVNRLLLRSLLKTLDVRFEQCENGEEAIRYLKDTQEKHIVILLDLHMPIMDGYEVISYIQAHPSFFHHTQISIIVISASDYFSFQQRCPDADIVTYIQKPVSRDILQQALKQAYANFQVK
ncbi:response regulator [Flectobacillus major]|jgi:CheY-like chemotaxis protein|uniref:response regulator n=1 Tax=Flectobacillus major TaxID=103 RepID=UPI00047D5A77|nr:response regulator [Flectobacillus major]